MSAHAGATWRLSAALISIGALVATMLVGATGTASATFSGTDGKIAFIRQNTTTDQVNIWSVNADGTGEVQLTNSGTDLDPAWSPDGQRIAFSSERDASPSVTNIYLMNSNGSNQTRLTPPETGYVSYGHPTWSADQKYLVADKDGNGIDGIYGLVKIDLASGAITELVDGPADETYPALSPNGQMLAWSENSSFYDAAKGQRTYIAKLVVANSDGTNPTVLAERTSDLYVSQGLWLEWHPGSTKLEWAYSYGNGPRRQATVSTSGTMLYDRGTNQADWAPAPSGTKLAMTYNQSGNYAIWSAGLDGTPISKLTSGSQASSTYDFQPSWQSIGTQVLDFTKPSVTITTPSDSGSYVQDSVVAASYNCQDDSGGSGVASCIGTVANGAAIDTATVGAKTFTVTATDNAGNTRTKTVGYTVSAPPDDTKPTISINTPADSSTVTQGTILNADYSCSDTGGSGLASCVGTVANGAAIDTATVGAKTFTVTATDNAGNSDSKSVGYTVIVPPPSDETAPSISITQPVDGATVNLGDSVTAQYGCDDSGGSGVASCIGTVANGAAIDTATVGAKTFTVTATDNAGNTRTKTVGYNVVWPFGGYKRPVDPLPVINTTKAGGVVPVKFSLGGNRGLAILSDGYPKSVQVSCLSGAETDTIEETGSAGSSLLSYDAASDTYAYNWKTDKSWKNTCRQFVLKLSDGATYRAGFKFS